MTIDEAIALVKIERECVTRADVCDRKCEKCDLVQDSGKLIDMYEHLAEWLEELVMLRLDSCMIHMPERLQLVENGYNKALNNLVNACEKQFTTMYGQRYVDMRDIVNIAEQLKAGGNS